jgi:hypothetical protein
VAAGVDLAANVMAKLTPSDRLDLSAELERIVAAREAARARGERPPAMWLVRP